MTPRVRPGVEPEFHRLHPLTPLLRGGVFLVAVLVALAHQATNDLQLEWAAVAVVGAVVAGLVLGAVSWWFTRYRIDADELRVESGVFVRRSRRIRIDRLQAVDVVQPFVARLFRMAELRLEVAGGGRTEAPLAYLPLDEAHRLRSLLLDRAARTEAPAARAQEPAAGAREPAAGAREPAACAHVPAAPERVLAAVRPGQLLGGALLSTQFLGSALTILVTVGSLVATGRPLGLALVVPWVLGMGSVVARELVGMYAFTVSETGNGLRLRRGLFDLTTQTVPIDRVQGVCIVEPVVWRQRGWARLEIDVAGYVESDSDRASRKVSILLPVADRAVARSLVREVLPGVDVDGVPLRPAPARARFAQPLVWRWLSYGADDSAVVTRRGWLVRRTAVVPHAKVQSLRVRQGPWQRRLRLADVHVDSPPGPVNAVAKHRGDVEAWQFVLAQAERSRLARQRSSLGPPASGQVDATGVHDPAEPTHTGGVDQLGR